MSQLIIDLDQALIDNLDGLVAEGVAVSRSAIVEQALRHLLEELDQTASGELVAEGYRRLPETPLELEGITEATKEMIREEPW